MWLISLLGNIGIGNSIYGDRSCTFVPLLDLIFWIADLHRCIILLVYKVTGDGHGKGCSFSSTRFIWYIKLRSGEVFNSTGILRLRVL